MQTETKTETETEKVPNLKLKKKEQGAQGEPSPKHTGPPSKHASKIQIELGSMQRERIEKARELSGSLKSLRDVIYAALSLFFWGLEQRMLGRKLASYAWDEKEQKNQVFPLIFPPLDDVQAAGNPATKDEFKIPSV